MKKIKNPTISKNSKNMSQVSFMSWKSNLEIFLMFLKHFEAFFSGIWGKAILLKRKRVHFLMKWVQLPRKG